MDKKLLNELRKIILLCFMFILICSIVFYYHNTNNNNNKNVIDNVTVLSKQLRNCKKMTRELNMKIDALNTKYSNVISYTAKAMEEYILTKNKKVFPELADIIVSEIFKQERKYNFPPGIIISIIDVESDFNIYDVSNKGAIGLMQSNYKQWMEQLKKHKIIEYVYDLYDPRKNIRAGAYILDYYYKKNNYNDKKTLQAYFGNKDGNSYYKKILKAFGEWWMFLFRNDTNRVIYYYCKDFVRIISKELLDKMTSKEICSIDNVVKQYRKEFGNIKFHSRQQIIDYLMKKNYEEAITFDLRNKVKQYLKMKSINKKGVDNASIKSK